MKRFHVHVTVHDVASSIPFYSTMFGQAPSVVKHDYAKWMVEDPRLNFAISTSGHPAGVNHLGIQVDSDEELKQLREQVAAANVGVLDQAGAACCYAKSDKYWTMDPQGLPWETYHTLDSIPTYGEDRGTADTVGQKLSAACCMPEMSQLKQVVEVTAKSKGCCS